MRPIALLLLALVACEASYAEPVRAHSRDQFMFLAIAHLVTRDDLYDVRAIARSLHDAEADAAHERFASSRALAQQRAMELAAASSTADACRKTAGVAEACVRCHLEARVTPSFPSAPDVPVDVTERQLWAIDRMFEGLMAGSNESWLTGLDVLARPVAMTEDVERDARAHRLQTLAAEARARAEREGLAARARTYGEILVACAECHTPLHVVGH